MGAIHESSDAFGFWTEPEKAQHPPPVQQMFHRAGFGVQQIMRQLAPRRVAERPRDIPIKSLNTQHCGLFGPQGHLGAANEEARLNPPRARLPSIAVR